MASVDGDHYKITSTNTCAGVVVRSTTSKRYGIFIVSPTAIPIQTGSCTNTATLPSVITQAAGRGWMFFEGTNGATGFVVANSGVFLGSIDNAQNAKLYVYAIDLSELA